MAKENAATLYAIIDLETTGGSPQRDRITEVAIILYDGESVIERYSTLVNPERGIPSEITRITGIDNDMVKDAPRFFEIARKVVELTEGAVFVAHNVRFDYGFLHQAFRRLGYSFTRKQLCTVKLARKLLEGLPSYSLSNLCKELGIVNTTAHRAMSDAAATLELFQYLTDFRATPQLSLSLQAEIASSKLPPKLDPQLVDDLPDEAGVYYFYDERGNILYIGKSNKVRKRVLSHFSAAHKRARTLRLIEQIADISYTLTGSELIALLLENEEIKAHLPPYNRKQRRRHLKIAVYDEYDKDGYRRLAIKSFDPKEPALAGFADRTRAERALQRKAEAYQLCMGLCGLANCRGKGCFYQQLKLCQGAAVGMETPEVYNERVAEAVANLIYGEAHFLVIGQGRSPEERSVVAVERGIYQGFGYFDPEFVGEELADIRAAVIPKAETPDVRQIIQGYVRKHPREVRKL